MFEFKIVVVRNLADSGRDRPPCNSARALVVAVKVI
jgi:hypothetical protein